MESIITTRQMEYQDLIYSKRHSSNEFGMKPLFIPDTMFDFQKYGCEYAIKKGRCALFFDTGLGKTFIELAIAANYAKATNKPVLIITPLAVGQQTLGQAEKFGIDDISYTRDGKYKTKIVVINYERLHYLDANDFDCVILDESSILKNFDGAIKGQITSFLKKVKYRYLFTATPSPNDFIELGTSSEALGYLGYTDMLTKFFRNNEDTINPMNIGTEWVLKGHAKDSFFEYISGWSLSARKPSDLGFSDENYKLPDLFMNYHSVKNESNLVVNGQMMMFNIVARRQKEVQSENRNTIHNRVEKAIELASSHERSVYWCNLNPEGDLLEQLDKNAYQIKGSMNIDKKEELLLAFQKDEIKKLITKPKMTAFGLNWQHCGHSTYFPTWSYEQFYQAARRFYRFGRVDPVYIDVVHSDGQKRVLDSLIAKMKKADELFTKLNANLHKSYEIKERSILNTIQLPKFLNAS